jgi:DNA-binding NarL/FixJ family response regulator
MTAVLVADPIGVFRAGVRNALTQAGGFELFEADSLGGVVAILQERVPDVALIELDLPPLGAVAAVERLVETGTTRPIVWSLAPADDSVLAAVSAGAVGFLPKQITPAGLVRALQGALLGEAPVTRGLAGAMIEQLHRDGAAERRRRRIARLTAREREVLELVVTGASNREVAHALEITEFTVKRHVQNILPKLGLPSRSAAAAFYRDAVA